MTDDLMYAFRAEQRAAFMQCRPEAHALVTGITDVPKIERGNDYAGVALYTSEIVPYGKAVLLSGKAFLNPWDYRVIQLGRPPLYTRHMLGTIEAERYARRKAKGRR